MSLFLYLFFIPNKRSVGITHTKYYRTNNVINIVSILNMEGTTVYRRILIENEDSKEFKLPDLVSGTYLFVITSGPSTILTSKFIVIKSI